MKSILFFLLLLSSNLLVGQEYKDYFVIALAPPTISNYCILLKEGIVIKDSILPDSYRWVSRRDSLVNSSLQRKLTELLRNEVIDKYHLKEISFRIDITCNKEGEISDCGFSIEPEDLQYFPESLLLKIYSLFVAEVEPAFFKKIIDEFWESYPKDKRKTGHMKLLMNLKLAPAQNKMIISIR